MIDEQKSLHLKREKRLKQNEQGLGNLRGNIKKSKICVIQVPEEEEREKKGWERYLNTYWAKTPQIW